MSIVAEVSIMPVGVGEHLSKYVAMAVEVISQNS